MLWKLRDLVGGGYHSKTVWKGKERNPARLLVETPLTKFDMVAFRIRTLEGPPSMVAIPFVIKMIPVYFLTEQPIDIWTGDSPNIPMTTDRRNETTHMLTRLDTDNAIRIEFQYYNCLVNIYEIIGIKF